MISVPMTADGPDMDQEEALIKDPAVKGMWNVPKYSNPEGVIYSAATIDRLAKMKPAAVSYTHLVDAELVAHFAALAAGGGNGGVGDHGEVVAEHGAAHHGADRCV